MENIQVSQMIQLAIIESTTLNAEQKLEALKEVNGEDYPELPACEKVNIGKELDEAEKKMLAELKNAVNTDDVKTLSSGKTDLSYLSWAQISKALTETLGKNNWFKTDLTKESLEELVDGTGYFVTVTISLFKGKIIHRERLTVMDSANKPIKLEPYTYSVKYGDKKVDKTVEALNAFNILKNHQRCFVKAIAVATGLGIELYTGEDLPNPDDEIQETSKENKDESPKKTQKSTPKKDTTKKDVKKSSKSKAENTSDDDDDDEDF